MTSPVRIHGIGARADIIVEPGAQGAEADAELRARLEHLWSRCLVDDDIPGSPVRVALAESDDGLHAAHPNPDVLCSRITQAVTRELLGQRIGERILLHAGCVAHPVTGAALVMVAPGGTGKTTLVRGLARKYAYVTDESVALDASGAITPYPKPLSIVGLGSGHKDEQSPNDAGLVELRTQPTLRSLVLLERDSQGSDEARVEELSLLDGIEALAAQSSSLHKVPEPLQQMARITDLVDGVRRWHYSQWESLLPLVHELLGDVE